MQKWQRWCSKGAQPAAAYACMGAPAPEAPCLAVSLEAPVEQMPCIPLKMNDIRCRCGGSLLCCKQATEPKCTSLSGGGSKRWHEVAVLQEGPLSRRSSCAAASECDGVAEPLAAALKTLSARPTAPSPALNPSDRPPWQLKARCCPMGAGSRCAGAIGAAARRRRFAAAAAAADELL